MPKPTKKSLEALTRLQNAETAYYKAQSYCPHWDYEGNSPELQDCCIHLEKTRLERNAAARAYSKRSGE